ncbi:hypothetical protein NQ317_006153 [Molorchus minor]|uniref:Uncharacterized protein n=1 Tax=Molorchus minor TaxID=1323400 RepID=A0ABQ9K275_9CUCU|nr:hypothetical protein NQ317_006153 [Molorchus minor]
MGPLLRPTVKKIRAQLINLFNLMCNNIAIEGDPTLLDACIGCFARASRSSNNQPSVSVLGECSDLYLVDTRYDDCVGIISAAQQTTNGNCVNGYCAFVRCVRRVNSDLLIARCYSEASEDNAAELEEDQIILFKNITSCILAMARCAPNNPITGQPQSNTIQTTSYNKLGIPITNNILLYNTLQVNQAGDLRTITFPETTNIQKYVCPYEFNLRQTSWLGYRC